MKGDRVGIWSPNRSEWLLTQFATARIGAVLVNINPAYRLSGSNTRSTVGCKAVIAAERFKTSAYVEMLQTIAPERATATPGDLHAARACRACARSSMGDVAPAGMFRGADLMARGPLAVDPALLDAIGATLSAGEPINIQFTSGTTGSPKGATLTHRNVVNNGRLDRDGDAFHRAGHAVHPGAAVSLRWCSRCSHACRRARRWCSPAKRSTGRDALAAVADERCTALHGVPTMFIAGFDHPEFAKFDPSTLRTGIMAGSPCPIETMKRVVSQMHLSEITIAYGMTETVPRVVPELDRRSALTEKRTTMGRIQPHLEVKIVDPSGAIVPARGDGRSHEGLFGDARLLGRRREDARGCWWTAGCIRATSRRSMMDGYCNIVGRLKDMVIRGGENVLSARSRNSCFGIRDSRARRYSACPMRSTARSCAWIVLRADEQMTRDDVRAFCNGQIAHYKIPRYIRFVDELPMTVTGKVQEVRDARPDDRGAEARRAEDRLARHEGGNAAACGPLRFDAGLLAR